VIRRILAPSLAGTALGLFCSPALGANRPGDGFEVASYRLALTPDIHNRTVAGRETITLRATVDGVQRLNFSANALTIDSAALNGVALTHTMRGDVLGFELSSPLRRGRTVKLALMLLCWSRVFCRVLAGAEMLIDLAGDVAFQASTDFTR